MELYPAHVHSWTQSDRLAIAMKFQENGFDFFHPATYNLLTKGGITQVDFPIHDYVIALISKFSGTGLIITFRMYNLLYLIIGLFFFYRSLITFGVSANKALLILAFLQTIPFLVYYQNGFLPSIPSFANFCIGLYFVIKFYRLQKISDYIWASFFLTLAALARLPFSIFLLALLLERALKMIQGRDLKWKQILLPLIGLLMVITYFFYNSHLGDKYGSMFLSSFRTLEDRESLSYVLSESWDRWRFSLIGPFHLIILGLAIIVLWVQRKNLSLNELNKRLLTLLLISSLGAVSYFYLMGLQFIDHDYYYIDSFLPCLSMTLILISYLIRIPPKWYTSAAAFSLIAIISMYSHAKGILDYRYNSSSESRAHFQYKAFSSAVGSLDDWGIKKEDTLAIFDISSTNVPFTLWGNHGYTSLNSGKIAAENLLSKDFDHAVLIDSFKISDSYFDYPGIANKLEYKAGNKWVSIYKKQRPPYDSKKFFKSLYLQFQSDFENSPDSTLDLNEGGNRRILDDLMGQSLKIDEEDEYNLTIKLPIEEQMLGKDLQIALQTDLFPTDSAKGLQIVIQLEEYYFSYYIENEIDEIQNWQKINFFRRIPANYLKAGSELKIYFWNPSSSQSYVDNYHLIIYE